MRVKVQELGHKQEKRKRSAGGSITFSKKIIIFQFSNAPKHKEKFLEGNIGYNVRQISSSKHGKSTIIKLLQHKRTHQQHVFRLRQKTSI